MKINKIRMSFSSDDEVPLKYYDNEGSDQSASMQNLYEHSTEYCEFCDKAFNNRYKSLVHNATHIIIPLLNQNIVKCAECLFCFTSQDSLLRHVNAKHPSIVMSETDLVKSIKRKDKYAKRERLKNRLMSDDVFNNVTAELLDDLTTDCSVKVAIADQSFPNMIPNDDIEKSNNNNSLLIRIDISDSDVERKVHRNRYVFGKRSTPAHRVYREENNVYGSLVTRFSGMDKVVLELDEAAVDDEYHESVHYDALRKLKTVKCRHCKKKFPHRYDLLVHEVSHIGFDRSLPHLCAVCDWYVAGDREAVRRHMRTHPPDASKRETSAKCLKCGLLYRRYTLHCNNYHRSESDVTSNVRYDKIMEICDLCFDFLKSSQYRHYIKIGSVSRLGQRYTCSRCTRKFFELHRVKKTEAKCNWKIQKRQNKLLTNNQRLKNIQHRLKNINKMRKF